MNARFATGLAAFYAISALFGLIYAGTMHLLFCSRARQFPMRMIGTVIGGAMAGSLSMATGPMAGALLQPTFKGTTSDAGHGSAPSHVVGRARPAGNANKTLVST